MRIITFNENSEFNYGLALKKIEEQDFLFAIRLLKDAIKIDKNPKYYIELAELYYKLGQYEESTATYLELSNHILTMEIALGVLHSHQASLDVSLNPDGLSISSGSFFKISRNHLENHHLNRILKEYQSIALNDFEPKMIDVKENSALRKLSNAKELALSGDYIKAMNILDSINDDRFQNKILELRIIIHFGMGEYENVLRECYRYNEKIKGNPTVARSLLYALYVLDGKHISPKFRNTFNDFEEDLLGTNNPQKIIALYELAEMVGYTSGAKKLMKKMVKRFPYDLSTAVYAIAYYGANENQKELDKLLSRLNETHTNSPSVAFYNCMRRAIEDSIVSYDAWYGLVDGQIVANYVQLFVYEYIKLLVSDAVCYDEDLLKSAITYLGVDELKDFLTIKQLENLPQYKEILIWGIENPYLGLENKVLLVNLYVSKYPNSDRTFIIPTELGISCLRLSGRKADMFECSPNSVYNTVYSNIIFTEHDFDSRVLWNTVNKVCLLGDYNKNLLCACAHCLYYKHKKYEPLEELVASTYHVSVIDLKELIQLTF